MATLQLPEALGALADNLIATGKYAQAVQCLKSLVIMNVLPDVEAKARLALGKLLVTRTHNIAEAKAELQRAVRFMRLSRPLLLAAHRGSSAAR